MQLEAKGEKMKSRRKLDSIFSPIEPPIEGEDGGVHLIKQRDEKMKSRKPRKQESQENKKAKKTRKPRKAKYRKEA